MDEGNQDVLVVDPIGEEEQDVNVVDDDDQAGGAIADQEGQKDGGPCKRPRKSVRPNPDPELGEVDPVHFIIGKEPNSDGEIVTSVTRVTPPGLFNGGGDFVVGPERGERIHHAVVGGKSPALAHQLALDRARAQAGARARALEEKNAAYEYEDEDEDEVSLIVSSSSSRAVSDADEDEEEDVW